MAAFGGGILGGFTKAAQAKLNQQHDDDQKQKDEERKLYQGIVFDNRSVAQGGPSDEQRQYAQKKLASLSGSGAKKTIPKIGDIFARIRGSQQPQTPPPSDPGAHGADLVAKARQDYPSGFATRPDSGGVTENLPNGQPAPGTAGSIPGRLPTGPSTPAPASSAATLGMPPGGGAMTTQPATPKPGVTAAPGAAQATSPKTPAPQPQKPQQQAQGGVPIMTDADIQARQGEAAQAETKRKLASEQQEQDFWLERGKKILGEDANPRDLAEYAGSKGARLPAQQKRVSDKGVARPGEDPSTGKQYEGVWDHIVEPDGSETWAKRDSKSASARATVIASDVVDLDSAKALSEAGAESYPGEDGKDIDLKKIPAGMVLQRVHQPGRDTFYQPRNIADKVIHVGNEVIAVSPLQVQQVPQGAGTTLGEVRTGTTNTPTQVIRDNDGVPHVVGTTSQPNTPGPRRAEQSTPGGQSASQPGAGPSPRSGIANPPGPRTPAPAGGGREVQGVTPGMDKDYLQTARSVQQALTQVVGDESNPNLKTVVSLAPDVLKDSKKTERVGKAIRMMLGGDSGLEGAHVSTGASIGPVSIGVGGFGEFLKQSLNMDAKVADKINENLKSAMKDMTPDEKNLVDATVSAFEESIAMRAINKSGVSNAQVGAIQNTLPLIGTNTFSVDEFATRMQNWAQQGLNGTWGVPPQYFRKGFIDKLKSVSDDMEKLRSKGQPSPKAKSSLPPKVGSVEGGYKFKGGDPANKNNWETVQ